MKENPIIDSGDQQDLSIDKELVDVNSTTETSNEDGFNSFGFR